MNYTAIRLVYVEDGVVWKERVRQGDNVGCVVCGVCERLDVVLWEGRIVKCGNEEMIVGDVDCDVGFQFG